MLKISGEALQGGMGFGVDPQVWQGHIVPHGWTFSINYSSQQTRLHLHTGL